MSPPQELPPAIEKSQAPPQELSLLMEKCLLVCVNGAGGSGSGVICDFLSEFSTVAQYCNHSPAGGGELLQNPVFGRGYGEFQFLRLAGGLWEFELSIAHKNQFYKSDMIKRYRATVEHWAKYCKLFNDKFQELSEKFLQKLIEFEMPAEIIVKTMPVSEFRALARQYLRECFTESVKQFQRPIILWDNALGDWSWSGEDIERKFEYFDNLKICLVWRDPRDVFAENLKFDWGKWMPQNPADFIKYYRLTTAEFMNVKHENVRVFRFEDIVFDYKAKTEEIMAFIGLEKEDHKHPKGLFDPDKSSQNIGIWKSLMLTPLAADIEMIHDELESYCWEGKE